MTFGRNAFAQDLQRLLEERTADGALVDLGHDFVAASDRHRYPYPWTGCGLPIIPLP